MHIGKSISFLCGRWENWTFLHWNFWFMNAFPFDTKICFILANEYFALSMSCVFFSLVIPEVTISYQSCCCWRMPIKASIFEKFIRFPVLMLQYEWELSSQSLTLAMTSMKKTMNHSLFRALFFTTIRSLTQSLVMLGVLTAWKCLKIILTQLGIHWKIFNFQLAIHLMGFYVCIW